MLSKTMSRYAVSVLGFVFAVSIYIGLSGTIAKAENPPGFPGLLDGCGNNEEFTTVFRLEDCKFKTRGINPYFILKPGYRLVLETPEGADEREKSVETVLCETKWINLDGRWIKTRVVEERALELDDGEWVTIEISRNYFAICKKTNAVYYFGEDSRDCPDGFDENDVCTGEESTAGSWEAGVGGARPGLIMPGTPLIGAKYFQEIAPPAAVDRGEIMGLGLEIGEWSGCIQISDTNPSADPPVCEDDEDVKTYCPGIGLVQDQELELVWYGFVGCDGDSEDDDNDGEEEDDDFKHNKNWRWGRR